LTQINPCPAATERRELPVGRGPRVGYASGMFTIEHDFDATVITLVDEGEAPLGEDVIVRAGEDGVTVEQLDPDLDMVVTVVLSLSQLRDLAAALNLPEGIYRRAPTGGAGAP
jgi:hypothetical protein